MVGISERALRPLINEEAPDIKANAIQKIGSGVSKGHAMGAENVKTGYVSYNSYGIWGY